MFKKILVAEDMDDINKGVVMTLSELNVGDVHHVQYCDDAYLKLKKANQDQQPFELMITDLSFKADHREQKYPSGEDLLKAITHENFQIKIIVYSVEDRSEKVRLLLDKYHINAYVCKSRRGLKELAKAIEALSKDEQYLSPQVAHALRPQANLDIDDFDILLVEKLSNGLSQDEISYLFKKNKITPSSLSSIEKRLNRLKIQFKANNSVHLISKVKDLGLI